MIYNAFMIKCAHRDERSIVRKKGLTMLNLHPQFVVNARGKEVAVLLPLDEYERLLEELEMQDDIRAAEQAKAAGENPIPLEQALAQLDAHLENR